METILTILREYGHFSYVVLFLYCGLKSGSLPLFAGIAAQLGALNLGLVACAVFLGGYLGDEIRFYFGRKYGVHNLSARPGYQKALGIAKLLLDRYGKIYLFVYRYPKGLRTIGALPITLTNITWPVFTALNIASALSWTIIMVGAGFWFGSALEGVIGDHWGLLSVALLSAFFLLSYLAWWRVRASLG